MKRNGGLLIFLLLPMIIYTRCLNSEEVPVPNPLSDEELLDLVKENTFQYFWEEAESNLGMARERILMDGIYL